MHSNLHQAQSHEILRSWQSQRNDINQHKDFVLPMFIGNNDDSVEDIEAMPGVNRYGVNRALEYLEPLVYSYGLRSILLFPVIAKSDQLNLINAHDIEVDDAEDSGRDIMSSSNSSTSSSNSSTTSDDGEQEPSVKPERLLPVDESSDTFTNLQNPFLDQNEEEEDHLLDEQNERVEVGLSSSINNNAENIRRIKVDIRLIKCLAFLDENNPVLRLIPMLRAKFPQLLIICDVCLCAFTSTGHCCLFEDHVVSKREIHFPGSHNQSNWTLLNDFPMANKLTCQYLASLSVEYALRGCHVIAPSDMMDGRILTIRKKLNENKLHHVSIMSYSAKFASAFYGPFRQATNNAPEFGDRKAYQLPPGSRTLALRAVERDIQQGADFIMVKPAAPYLDIVRDIKEAHPDVPIAVYQVSGEYSMLKVAAESNLIDLKLAVNEILTAFRRAGATIIISYFTPELLRGEL